jgi:hypothetical protein
MSFVKTRIFLVFLILSVGFTLPSFADEDCHDQIVNEFPVNFSDDYILNSIKNSTEYNMTIGPLWEFDGIDYGGTIGSNCKTSNTTIIAQFSSIYISPPMKLMTSFVLDSYSLEIKDIIIKERLNISHGGPNGPFITKLFSPHYQTKYGVKHDNVLCNRGLEVVIKNNDSPACVKPETKIKLLERGWLNQLIIYEVIGLNNEIVSRQPIKISIDKWGWNSCNEYNAKIYPENSDISVWHYQSSSLCVVSDSSTIVHSIFDVPGNGQNVVLNQTGNYVFEIELNGITTKKDFNVLSYVGSE